MGKRRDPRIEAKLPIRVAGIDVDGRPVLQKAATRNISRGGALLEGIEGRFKPEEIVSLTYKNNKARFRVSWIGEIGTDRAGQMAVQSVDATKCIWDATILPPPVTDNYAEAVKERRQHRRVPCRLGAELYVQGADALVRMQLTNISVGGCFLAMPTLPPDKSRVKIGIWAREVKLTLQGVVASRRTGFGIAIKFTEMPEEAREQLQHLLESLVVRGE